MSTPSKLKLLMQAKRTIGLHLESSRGTRETLTGDSYGIPAYNVTYSPSIASYARKIAHGDYSHSASVAGSHQIDIRFSIDMNRAALATCAPRYFEALRACAMKQEDTSL